MPPCNDVRISQSEYGASQDDDEAMMPNRLYVGGRGLVFTALPLPSSQLGFWRSLDEIHLCAMARCLLDSQKGDLPPAISADLDVWGDEAWTHVGGLDMAEELTVALYDDDGEIDLYRLPGADEALHTLFGNPPEPTAFAPPRGKTCLLHYAYEKAGYFHQIEDGGPLDVQRITLKSFAVPELQSRDLSMSHRIMELFHEGAPLLAEYDYYYDYGECARLIMF